MRDDSKGWLEAVDRGGLKHVTNMTYMLFVSGEMELRKYISRNESPISLNLMKAKEELLASDNVQFYWSMVSSNWKDNTASVLLNILIDHYIQIRGHSTASAWLEQYKREKSVQKSKGVRKTLLSSSEKSSSSGSSTDS